MEEGSTALRVSQPGDGAAPLVIPSLKAPKNGYAFIYLSNENDDPVYWDDFTVSYTRGSIIEENHYYAFGLRISGISSRKYDGGSEGSLKNEFLYNDKELWEDADLNWYDYGFRNYDAQIARFTQLDPLTWDYPELTNYQYASNEPIANVDLDGLEASASNVAGKVFNLPQMLDPVVITAKLPAAGAKVGATIGSLAGGMTSFVNLGVQQISRGTDNTYVNPSPQQVERIGDNTLQSTGQRQVLIPGQQVMESITWFDKLSGPRSVITDDGFGNKFRLAVDNEGYLTNNLALTSLEVPFVPERSAFNVVKFLKGASKGVKVLQSGGHTLNSATLKALKLSKEQGKIAIEALKKAEGLPNNAHFKIMSDGSVVDPHNGINYGKLFDYLP